MQKYEDLKLNPILSQLGLVEQAVWVFLEGIYCDMLLVRVISYGM